MLIPRSIQEKIVADIEKSGKVILIYGPRQAGKTTLSKQIIKETGLKTLAVNADQLKYNDILSSRDLTKLNSLVGGYELVFIDEGQRVEDIGINLKILHDEIPELKVLVTGSSSFLLSGRVTESLTGRKKIYTLLPISYKELASTNNSFELHDQLEERLIYGCYPEVINLKRYEEKEEYLRDISESYIYKDILELEQIKYPSKIRDLLRLLAYQVDSQVSIHELCNQLNLNRETVERYLHLLEQSFIIYRLSAFSRNLRKEISKSHKYYFYDNGIRNILIDNLKTLSARNDTGALWENFILAERKKKLMYEKKHVNTYFWRTYSGAELDYVEETGVDLQAFEIKYGKAKAKAPQSWVDNYSSDYCLINRNNYLDFII
ncbi:MAG: ATP-binding protein [Bacteroidales bacterium]|nr:ATP-binding protein [Bacteroidales bacterium]MCF8344752.1 ATP-binding protein [Bacteroidales bacterium]MCF8352599.1 ATP-binding protein [Bacteroidales bacterium]MCF8377337.1 ATP-binding protein [Bacteroidales bacterium]MCF8401917.1 ATP-binding protein [Bacteroidales bacterium]